ncbi:MAG TPA: GAF domain-containing protein [Methylomirabilota bacterium]
MGRLSPAALEALAEVTLLLSRQFDLEPLLQQITDSVADLTGAHNVVLWEADWMRRRVVRRAATTDPAIDTVDMPVSLAFGEGGTGWVASHRQTLVVPDVTADPRIVSAAWAMRYDLIAFTGVPLVAGDELVGVLTLNLERGHVLGKDDQALLSSFAAQAAVAIRNANLFRDAASRSDRLRRVADLARSVSGALDLETVLSEVTAAVVELRSHSMCIIRLVDAEAGGYRLAGMGGAAPDGRTLVLPFGHGLTHVVAETRKALVVTDTGADPRTANQDWYASLGLSVYYGVPIVAGDELLGVLNVSFPAGESPTGDEREAIGLFASQAAVAIRNANLFAESEGRRRAAEALAHVGRILSRALDPDVVARQVADSVRTLFSTQSSALYRLDPESGKLVALAVAGDMGVDTHVVPRGALLIGLAVSERQPVFTANVLADPRVVLGDEERDRIARGPDRAGLAVPLVYKDAVIGALAAGDREGRVFRAEEIALAQAFADQAAVALENARLYEQTRQRLRQLDSLREVVEQILVAFSLEERLTLVARHAAALFDADRALVALLNEAGDGVTVRAGHSLVESEIGVTIPLSVGAVGLAAALGEGVLVNDYQSWPGRRRDHPVALASIIAYPLLIRGEVIGALSVGFTTPTRRLTPSDLERLATLAAPAALAIEHSRLYEQLEVRLRELRETQAQLVQAGKMSAVGQLVSGVAHELNNPLSVVIGYGHLMLRKNPPPEILKQVEAIVAQADRMAKIVQSLLLFSRQRKPERIPMRLPDVLERTLAMRETQLRLSGIRTVLENGNDVPPVAGDGQQLQQVFLNLLLNAEQAILMSRVGDCIAAGVSKRMEAGMSWVCAHVRDNGPGIPTDVLPRIFEPFFTTKEVGSGTGLGLSVSYGIVEQHGGRIEVESRPGDTVFTVMLPAVTGDVRAAAPKPLLMPRVTGNGRRALVVDDEAYVVDLVATLLGYTGWVVDVAASGRDGLAHVERHRYDLVVSDIRMPEGDGESFYRVAVARQPELGQRFIVITGDTASQAAWAFLEQTRLPALQKPFTPDAFFRLVEQVVPPA